MASRSATLRELQSLRNELGTEQRGRERKPAPSAPKVEPPGEVAKPSPTEAVSPQDDPADSGPRDDDIGALMREVADYLEERAGDMAAHPLAIALGGLVVGLIIGRLLPRR
jgi:hypothetical protein